MAPDRAPAKQWRLFVHRCLQRRVRAHRFEAFAKELRQRAPLPSIAIAATILSPPTSHSPGAAAVPAVDPLVPVYVERLLGAGVVDAADVLGALLGSSRHRPAKSGAETRGGVGDEVGGDGPEGTVELEREPQDGPGNSNSSGTAHNLPELEETMFYRVAKAFHAGEGSPRSVAEARRTLYAAIQWMMGLVTSGASDSMMDAVTGGGGNQQARLQSALVREALGVLAIALLENDKVVAVLDTALPKVIRQKLAETLSLFVSFLSQTSMQVANRLEVLQKQRLLTTETMADLDAAAASGANAIDVGPMQVDAVMELPVINSRAGLYIFINSLLFARPLTDQSLILNYLHARYKGDIESLTVDLITASFDVLYNAMCRNESTQTMFILRSFLVNKIPTLLTILSGSMFQPLTPEYCIRQALSHVDPNAFPSFSQSFEIMGGSNMLSDVRQDFLLSCALHHLIPEDAVEQLLGEPPMSGLPAGGRYIKEDLIVQCSANSERVDEVLNELESVDGNAGAIVGALIEIIRTWCATKETMSLKTVCSALSRKPQSLDVILQFTSPSSILHPLCTLLDTWRYEEDQGEYQPVYDEFGGILLLVLAMVHRYEISHVEIGISHRSFVAQLLEHGHVSYKNDDLTEEQNKHLAGWVNGLFNPDGTSDEIMASCRPQDFYMLVPTLFDQTVLACSSDVLGTDTMHGGLEYLLETFLLPSLVGAIHWMTNYAPTTTQAELDVILLMATKLIRPSSMSGEAQAMHGTLLSIVAPRLSACLRTLKRREPSRSDLDPLLDTLKPHTHTPRSPSASLAEIDSWATTPGPSLRAALRATMQAMVLWSATPPNMNMTPPSYTPRQLTAALALAGARTTLRALLHETKSQTDAGSGPLALDVAAALVCAPAQRDGPLAVDWPASAPLTAEVTSADLRPPARQPPHPRTRLNLREALRLELEDAAALFAADAALAESAVRLHRRVETQLAGVAAAAAAAAVADASAGVAVGVGADGMPGMEGMLAEGMDMSVADAVADAAAAEGLGMAGVDGAAGAGGMEGIEGMLGLGDASGAAGVGEGGDLDMAGMLQGGDDDIFGDLQLDPDLGF